jgi:hypothetical protein
LHISVAPRCWLSGQDDGVGDDNERDDGCGRNEQEQEQEHEEGTALAIVLQWRYCALSLFVSVACVATYG